MSVCEYECGVLYGNAWHWLQLSGYDCGSWCLCWLLNSALLKAKADFLSAIMMCTFCAYVCVCVFSRETLTHTYTVRQAGTAPRHIHEMYSIINLYSQAVGTYFLLAGSIEFLPPLPQDVEGSRGVGVAGVDTALRAPTPLPVTYIVLGTTHLFWLHSHFYVPFYDFDFYHSLFFSVFLSVLRYLNYGDNAALCMANHHHRRLLCTQLAED